MPISPDIQPSSITRGEIMSDPAQKQDVLWLLLGRVVTVAMLPWMIWVSLSVVSMQQNIAVLNDRTVVVPPQWFQDYVRGIDVRVTRLEERSRGTTP